MLQTVLIIRSFLETNTSDVASKSLHCFQQVFVLSPARQFKPQGERYAQLKGYSHAVEHQRTFCWIVNVGFHNERIGPHLLNRIWAQLVACPNDRVAYPFDGLRTQEEDIITYEPARFERLKKALIDYDNEVLKEGPDWWKKERNSQDMPAWTQDR